MPLVDRKAQEEREDLTLAPWGMRSAKSRGRRYPEREHPLRTCYQRDRDRVVHSSSFRRLEYKTQVFVNHEGDNYRTRLTHSLEGAQIGRTVARAMGLNEELTECLVLGHDLGHTPIGHSGERMMNELMRDHGGFEHNRQTLRILERLERRYPEFPGLNLTWEVREGIAKHRPDSDATAPADYAPGEAPTLDAHIPAPQDDELVRLGVQINTTYIAFGAAGREGAMRQEAQDAAAESLAPAAGVARASAKASALYINTTWDLVDAVDQGAVKLEDVPEADLPEEMRPMSADERRAHLSQKAAERADIQKRIESGEIAARTAYELSKITNEETLRQLADQAAAGQLTISDASNAVRKRSGKPKAPPRGTRQVFVAENGWKVTVTANQKGTHDEIEQALTNALEEVQTRIRSGLQLF